MLCDFRDLGFKDDQEAARMILERGGIAVIPGSSFYVDPKDGRTQVRLCYGQEDEGPRAGLPRIRTLRRSWPDTPRTRLATTGRVRHRRPCHGWLARPAEDRVVPEERPWAVRGAPRPDGRDPDHQHGPGPQARHRAGARAAADLLRECGAVAEVVPTSGNPVVVGEFRSAPGRPTLTIYNHMDVQPAQEPEWRQEPFRFRVEDGRYFAAEQPTTRPGPDRPLRREVRRRERRAAQHPLPVGARRGDRQPALRGVHQGAHRLPQDRLDPGLRHHLAGAGKPAIPYGLRGLQPARLLLRTGGKDAHSGLTGGAARNPIGELAQVISRLYDARTGRSSSPASTRTS